MKTSDLEGAALDWAVAKCEGVDIFIATERKQVFLVSPSKYIGQLLADWNPSTNWAQAGPIIEREKIELKSGFVAPIVWSAWAYSWYGNRLKGTGKCGPTPLLAAMRCYVASKLGDEVDIPKELL